MSIGLLFWILMILWIVLGLYVNREGEFTVQRVRQSLARIMNTSGQYANVLERHPLCVDKNRVVNPTGEGPRRALVFAKSVLEGEPPI